jgi:hypothetical protein
VAARADSKLGRRFPNRSAAASAQFVAKRKSL